MLKAKCGDSVRSRTYRAMRNEVYCKFVAHNICCDMRVQVELGIEPVFWSEEPSERDEPPDVLPIQLLHLIH